MWNNLPVELKERIINKLTITQLIKMAFVSKECRDLVVARAERHIIECMLPKIVKERNCKKMQWWKKEFFDKLLPNSTVRSVLLAIIFFLMGKNNYYDAEIISCFQPFILAEEYHDFFKLGVARGTRTHLSNKEIEQIVLRNPELNTPLFRRVSQSKCFVS
jgi:hypothetical protein